MLSKILAKAALKAHKFQADFSFQKLDLASSNQLSTISISIKSGNQFVETIQRPKADHETEINECVTFITSIFYEEFKHKYQDKFLQIDVNLCSAAASHSIGYAKVDLSQFALLALENPYENDVILVLEKSPEYQAKLSFHLTLKYIGEEDNGSSILKKLKETSKTPPLSQEKPSKAAGNLLSAVLPGATAKRSVTPTPQSSQIQRKSSSTMRNREDRSKSKEKSEVMRKTVGNKFQQVANTVLLMKNATTKIVKRNASKSPPPRKEGFKALNITEPLFKNKYSNIFNEKNEFEKKILEIKGEKEKNSDKLMEFSLNLDQKEKECETYIEKIKNLELKNAKLKKEIEKNRVELKKSNDLICTSLENKEEKLPNSPEKQKEKEDEHEANRLQSFKEKLNELEQDASSLLKEKTSLEEKINSLKEENNNYSLTIKNLKQDLEGKNQQIEEINKKQMDLKNEYLNLKDKQPNLMNRNQINDLFSDNFRQMKQLEVQFNQFQEQISQGNEEILQKENRYFEEENLISKMNEEIPEKTIEKNKLQDVLNELEREVQLLMNELTEKDKKKIEMMEITMAHQDGYVKTKQDIADIFNLVFEKGGDDLMDELEKFLQ